MTTPAPALLAARMTEAELLASVRQLAAVLHIRTYHTYNSRRSEPGWPDLVLLGTGILFAELKSQRGVLSPEQRAWGSALHRAGQRWYCWRPIDWANGTIRSTLLTISPRYPERNAA